MHPLDDILPELLQAAGLPVASGPTRDLGSGRFSVDLPLGRSLPHSRFADLDRDVALSLNGLGWHGRLLAQGRAIASRDGVATHLVRLFGLCSRDEAELAAHLVDWQRSRETAWKEVAVRLKLASGRVSNVTEWLPRGVLFRQLLATEWRACYANAGLGVDARDCLLQAWDEGGEADFAERIRRVIAKASQVLDRLALTPTLALLPVDTCDRMPPRLAVLAEQWDSLADGLAAAPGGIPTPVDASSVVVTCCQLCTTDALGQPLAVSSIRDVGMLGPGGSSRLIHQTAGGTDSLAMAVLARHGADLPFHLAPLQAMVLPVTAAHGAYAERVCRVLIDSGLRAATAPPGGSLPARLRQAIVEGAATLVVAGDRERTTETAAVRHRRNRRIHRAELTSLAELVARIGGGSMEKPAESGPKE